MSLQISLFVAYGFPGSVLDGCIIARSEHGMRLTNKSLTVTLLGRSKIRVPSPIAADSVREGREIFLKITQTLNEQIPLLSDFLADGERSDFRIRFPEDATFKHIKANTTTAWPRLCELPEAKTLPPTGEFGLGNTIEYSVEAGVINQASGVEITISMPITFSPAREEIVPDPKPVNIVQARMLTNKPQHLDFRSIRLVLNGPTIIAQDNGFPLVLNLLDIIGGHPFPQPTVSLQSGFIRLLQHTEAWTNDDYGHRWTDVHTIISRDFCANGGPPQLTEEGTDLAALFLSPTISREFPPSFRSTNLERTYGLKVGLAVEFEDRVCEFSFDIDPVAILPGELHCMALARQEDKYWEKPFEERPFPDAVNKLRQALGI